MKKPHKKGHIRKGKSNLQKSGSISNFPDMLPIIENVKEMETVHPFIKHSTPRLPMPKHPLPIQTIIIDDISKEQNVIKSIIEKINTGITGQNIQNLKFEVTPKGKLVANQLIMPIKRNKAALTEWYSALGNLREQRNREFSQKLWGSKRILTKNKSLK